MTKLSFSRQILPALAILGILVAAVIVYRTQPDRTIEDPAIQPPTAPQGEAVVAGAGVVEPASELIEIGTPVGGVVERVAVQAGDRVSAGAPLFTIDSRTARTTLAEATARVERLRRALSSAETVLATARRQLALYDGVKDDRAVSAQEVIDRRGLVDEAAARLAVSRAELAEAEAQRDSARVALDRLTVRAPIAGEVLQVTARAGQFATAGPAPGNSSDPLVTMGETQPLHVRVDIDENEIDRIDLGKAATISARGNATRRYRARFVRVEPLVVPKRSLTNSSTERVDVRVLQLIFALEPGEDGLFVGQLVDAFVPAKPTPAETRANRAAGESE